ncbi:dihydroneopterin aldolase [Anianabacter salinae]|uniref:dihydroneopterin aldolase n=1 Tax=Anianabacter salinae TaxID=2851023 RepID=UPI00225E192B|nr:dihydroneopterin aldolase [Anianabacter salinae]MBV0913977.1 dihydroneopterin aldolase [Anianabacter salinae]
MTSDTTLAFEHPEARAEATRPRDLHDRISLRDHVREADIGAFQAERGRSQRLNFNVVVEVQPPETPLDDDVDRILSYDTITEAIDAELSAERLNLLETLAERLALRILDAPQARRVFVRIEKLDRGPGALGVEIARSRADALPRAPDESGLSPHPTIVALSNAAIASPHLAAWIDQLSAMDRALIFCVGPAGVAAPQAGQPAAQRRIDLLAIEQNAWVLAGRDQRCVVVGSRTELDWAMKHGQHCVWAPSKIVLDAIDGPSAEPRDVAALIGWFAGLMQAGEVLDIGMNLPTLPGVPMRVIAADAARISVGDDSPDRAGKTG